MGQSAPPGAVQTLARLHLAVLQVPSQMALVCTWSSAKVLAPFSIVQLVMGWAASRYASTAS